MLKKKIIKKSARRPVRKTVHKKGKRRTAKGEWSILKRSAERLLGN